MKNIKSRSMNKVKSILIFGAGKIGRSFIGPLFANSGYKIVFVDINQAIIDEINNKGGYEVILIKEDRKSIRIENIAGVSAADEGQVAKEVAGADIVAISAGTKALPGIISLIAKGVLKRFEEFPLYPLDIIIAENLRNAAQFMRKEFKEIIGPDIPVDSYVGLIETSVGKMVPIMTQKDTEGDILKVFAEPYNTLILDKKGFRNPVPDVKGLAPKDNIKAWVDRKSFIHNLGHVTTAFLGYVHNKEFKFIYEVLENDQIKSLVRGTMLEAATILQSIHPGEFTTRDLTDHIDDLIDRFENRSLRDTIFRVGVDLFRKLGPEDRLAGAIRAGIEHNKPVKKILYALVCGTFFRASDENGEMFNPDEQFIKHFNKGIEHVLTDICGFDKNTHPELFATALDYYSEISEMGRIGR
jgi:mannitol-1-phosphate 5-dehydrogenase